MAKQAGGLLEELQHGEYVAPLVRALPGDL